MAHVFALKSLCKQEHTCICTLFEMKGFFPPPRSSLSFFNSTLSLQHGKYILFKLWKFEKLSCKVITHHLYSVEYFQCLLPFLSLLSPARLFLEHPGDRDPLGVFGNRFQRCFDGAVCLVEVVVDNAEVKVVTISCLDFSTLIARLLQLFILWRKTDSRAVNHRTSALTDFSLFAASWVIHLLYVHIVVLWAIPTISVLVTTPASAADWFRALSTSNSGAWRNTM